MLCIPMGKDFVMTPVSKISKRLVRASNGGAVMIQITYGQ